MQTNRHLKVIHSVVILFCSFCFIANGQSLSEKIKFSHIDVYAGLSNSTVKSILQDSEGFMWFGTMDGLNKYDGYNFTVYRKKDNDSTGLQSNDIRSLFEDSRGNLWVSTELRGFYSFDRIHDRFVKIPELSSLGQISNIYEDETNTLWATGNINRGAVAAEYNYKTNHWTLHRLPLPEWAEVFGIDPISENEYWITTKINGIYKWNKKTNSLTELVENSLGKNIYKYVKDKKGILWFGTRNGLTRFDPTVKSFTHFKVDSKTKKVLQSNVILTLLVDGHYLWIGTENGGLSRMDTRTEAVTNITHTSDPVYLTGKSIWSLYKDKQGRVWVGTFSDGVYLYDKMRYKFLEISTPLINKDVNAIRLDKKGRLWIGTEGGITLQDGERVSHFTKENSTLSNNPVLSIFEDSKNQMWFGTYDGGLSKYNEITHTFTNYVPNANNPYSLKDPNVFSITEALKSKKLLVSSYNGLHVMEQSRPGNFIRYVDESYGAGRFIRTLFEDSQKRIWIGSITDLCTIDIESNIRTSIELDPDPKATTFINCINEDKEGTIWVGSDRGLHKISKNKEIIKLYTVNHGLANNLVRSILIDDHGNLWMGTTKGLSRFNPKTEQFLNFDITDGLNGNEFRANACTKNQDGYLFFGGTGINLFYPDSIKVNPHKPDVFFTGLKIFNKEIPIGDADSVLRQHISVTKEISLLHTHNFFSFEFVGLNFTSTEKNQYAYKLEGFDKDWVYTGSQRSATFTNLDPGSYTLRVKASNNDGLWNEEGASMVIHIMPPWWNTIWFKIVSTASVLFLILGLFLLRTHNIRMKNRNLALLVKEKTKELSHSQEQMLIAKDTAEAANKAKSEFLANMSHEIRTPLNGVIGFSDLLMKTDMNNTQQQYMSIVSQSARSLLSILNDILDFSKIEAGKLDLSIEKVDLFELVSQVTDLVKFQAHQKQLEMLLHLAPDVPRYIWSDETRLRQVLVNLLANAIKFTSQGEVELKIEIISTLGDEKKFRFTIRDTGIGIDPKNQEKIFEAFSQEDASTTKRFGGTGLGLAIANRLLLLMGSKLNLTSKVNEGSAFSFDVSFKAHPGELLSWKGLGNIKQVLIVDDNSTNRFLIREILATHNIHSEECASGAEAISILQTGRKFDALIIDYHMPKADGIETIRTIRTSIDPLNQPVILLCNSSEDAIVQAACEELEIHHRLIKPVKMSSLFDSLSEIRIVQRQQESTTSHIPSAGKIDLLEDHIKILLAEDNEVNMLLALALFKNHLPNAVILEANNGLLAIEKFKKHAPDIIFMDVRMPEKNGYEATKEIRKLEVITGTHVPIIALTAGASIDEKEKCQLAGMDDYISKPIIQKTILDSIKKWVKSESSIESRTSPDPQ